MSKGLEFDYVIVPYVDSEHYTDEFDKNLLYIAFARAMHKLDLFCLVSLNPVLCGIVRYGI